MRLGSFLPDICCPDENGDEFDLNKFKESRYLFVFFFPKANTPGCVNQACSLRDAYEDLVDGGVEVLGVSRDRPKELKQFKESRLLPYRLLSDREKRLSDLFAVPSLFGIVKRQAFLFHKGVLVWLDRSASTKKQAEDVLAEIKRLANK